MNYYKTETPAEISNLFTETEIEQYIVNNAKWNFSVFVCYFIDSELLERLWKQVSDVIASSYQAQLKGVENVFEKWNIYIIYVCKESVSKEMKARIETDKFSSRKIVEYRSEGSPDNEVIVSLITKHITHSDLINIVDDCSTNLEEDYEPNISNIWDEIPTDKLVSGNIELQNKIIEQLKTFCHEN